MANIIIECSNKRAQNSLANGDWQTILSHPILLESNDQVIIKDSYVDTQAATSQNIVVENDLDLVFDFGFYQVNITVLQGMYRNYKDDGAAPDADLLNYVLCKQSGAALANNIKIINSFSVKSTSKEINSIPGTLQIVYRDNEGNMQNETAILGEIDSRGSTIPRFSNIIYDSNTPLTYNPPLSSLNLEIDEINTSDGDNRKVFQPYILQKTIRLPAGNYEPDELCETINRLMTFNKPKDDFYATDSNSLLQTGQQIQSRFYDDNTSSITNFFGLCKAEAGDVNPMRIKTMMSFPNIGASDWDVLFGSSQFELEYDQPSSTFLLKYIHTPFYHNNALNNALFSINEGANDIRLTLVNKLGGIFFQNMYARDLVTGRITDFFTEKLGFDLENLLVNWNYKKFTTTGHHDTENIWLPSEVSLIEEKSTTGQLSVLDSVVNKTTPQQAQYPTDDSTPLYFTADPQKTNSIISNKTKTFDSINQFGYYLIEIKSQFKNNFLTEDNNFNHICQIVNRYYELNSFTSGESGQIVYEHQGDPLLLQSFHCRILKSDKTLATNVGDDNTIHLQIVKAPKVPSIIAQQQKEKKEDEKNKK